MRPRAFIIDYLRRRKPILLDDLYADQKISRIRDLEQARKHLGDVRIRINKNYYDAFRGGQEAYICTIKGYLDFISENPDAGLHCTEQNFPSSKSHLFTVPDWIKSESPLPPSPYFFVGKKGSIAPLHFDWDLKEVLLTQVVGRKRVIVFPPSVAKRLIPVLNTSSLSLHLLSEREKKHFIEANGGLDFTIDPGQTLYIPRLWWHYVEYLDFCISYNVRFGDTIEDRRIATLPRDHRLQNIMYSLAASDRRPDERAKIVREILCRYFSDFEDPWERFLSMRELYHELYAETCPDAVQGEYVGENFNPEHTLGKEEITQSYSVSFTLWKDPDEGASLEKISLLREALRGATINERLLKGFGITSIGEISELDATIVLDWISRAGLLQKEEENTEKEKSEGVQGHTASSPPASANDTS